MTSCRQKGRRTPSCAWNAAAIPGTPAAGSGQTPCGMSNRIFRKVLEYLPQSTPTASARHAQTSGTAGHARAADLDAHTDLRRDVPFISGGPRRTVKKYYCRKRNRALRQVARTCAGNRRPGAATGRKKRGGKTTARVPTRRRPCAPLPATARLPRHARRCGAPCAPDR